VSAISREAAPALKKKKMYLPFHVKRRPLKKKKSVSMSGVEKGRGCVKHRSQVKRLKIKGQAWSK
jgi:hypothetical protein